MAVEVTMLFNNYEDYDDYGNYEIYDGYDVDYGIRQEEQYKAGQSTLASMVIPVTNMRAYRVYSTDYKNIPPCASHCFQRPELYFWATDKHLRILGSSIELNMDEAWDFDKQKEVSEVLGGEWSSLNSLALCHIGPTWFKDLLQAIHSYLLQQHFTEYYTNLLQFKWHTGLRSFPLFDRSKLIQLVDGKLFGYCPELQVSSDGKKQVGPYYSVRLLTTETVNEEIKHLGGKIPTENKGIKAIVPKLARQLVNLHRDDPYAIIDPSDSPLTATYREGGLEFIPTLGCAKFSPHSNHRLPFPITLGSIKGDMCFSQQLENCLFNLTNGDLNKLDLLAEFFARIVCSTVPSKYLWYIHGNAGRFATFLFQLVNHQTSGSLYNVKGDKQSNLTVYNQEFNAPIQYNKNIISTDKFANLNHNKMKRYINGGEIFEIDDPYQVAEVCN